jgi:hypothetical protein
VLSLFVLAASALIPLVVVFIVKLGAPLRQYPFVWTLVLLLPSLALGGGVCALLLGAPGRRISRMYGADLLGAAVGAALAIPLLSGWPTPQVVAALGLLPAAALIALRTSRARFPLSVAALILVSLAWGAPYQLRYNKAYEETTRPLYERWTATARITVFAKHAPGAGEFFGWGMGSRTPPSRLQQLWLDQDGSAGTQIVRHERGKPPPEHLLYDVTSAAHQIRRPSNVCIIGAGGGRDILAALGAGATRIDAVELNPFIVDAVSRVFGGYSGDVYGMPGVRAIRSEGRSYLEHSRERYDVIQLSLVDTFAATAAGAYALSENGLYTVEAMRVFWSRLAPGGILSVSRFSAGAGIEAIRLAMLGVAALREEGARDPERHLLILEARSVANIMLLRSPVDERLLRAVDAVSARRGFTRLWPLRPGGAPTPISYALVLGPVAFERHGLDLSPPRDDRPFFFQTVDLLALASGKRPVQLTEREQSVTLLGKLLAVVSALALAFFMLPVVLRRRLPRGPTARRGSVYFFAIGLAFMFLEVPLVHRLTIYLGHPSYAATVVLGTLLLGAGAGAFLSGRISTRWIRAVSVAVPLVVGALCLAGVSALAATSGLGTVGRFALSIAWLAPAGFFMGFPFPIGMTSFGEENRSWYWALNGVAGVVASTSGLALSMVVGLWRVMLIGVACYGIAAVMFLRERRSRT